MSETNYNTQPAGLEKWLDEVLNKKSSVQLPDGGKKWLANNVWWLALVGGVLSLWGAVTLWQVGHSTSSLLNQAYGVTAYAQDLNTAWYAVLATTVVQGVILLLAFQKLKTHAKAGWNLLFYSSLVSVVAGVLYVFVPSYGASSLFGTAVGTLIGWFLLFQIRSHFTK